MAVTRDVGAGVTRCSGSVMCSVYLMKVGAVLAIRLYKVKRAVSLMLIVLLSLLTCVNCSLMFVSELYLICRRLREEEG